MSVELNHTIVVSRDRENSARFLAHVLGLEVGEPEGHFLPVRTANGVTLDFATVDHDVPMQHYAFLVSEAEFDAALDRLLTAGVTVFADPRGAQLGRVNRQDGGRGVYFQDPSGHGMEIITRPYGSAPAYGTTVEEWADVTEEAVLSADPVRSAGRTAAEG